ncbi:retinal guanylyl cyclase 1-like [Physella acuta]|uniref:retinal guanylyl cyclase 1-like n=1 Tax=Physella acuta TaxID=109671 RepID=UPI0027DC5AA4|nr:retinal guanylyl cyclase 1-like [Physella acuta]
MRDDIAYNNKSAILIGGHSAFTVSIWWFENMTAFLNVLFTIQNELATEIVKSLDESSRLSSDEISLSITLVCVFVLLAPIIVISVRILLLDIQKYANSLSEQSKELNQERKRAESLLYQMLPEQVAKQLKENNTVPAESYEDVTIFFSDVVGFTTIAASCSPLEVVDLLNNLYTCFDRRLELYDVYKVETIGDAYMVSSGVPKRNGRKHVTQIANMALDLSHHAGHIGIPHLPGRNLSLRAGIHTGPVVAGVVGSKMPRYCLFGDTVNTASRMESTGKADRIQVSTATCSALESLGCYNLDCRGHVEVKGTPGSTTPLPTTQDTPGLSTTSHETNNGSPELSFIQDTDPINLVSNGTSTVVGSVHGATLITYRKVPRKVSRQETVMVVMEFVLQKTDRLVLQGKGMMQTYWLLDKAGFEVGFPCVPGCLKFNDVQTTRLTTAPSDHMVPEISFDKAGN